MQPNLSAILIHNIFSFNINLSNYKYMKCSKLDCEICSFSSKSNLIKINDKYSLPIKCNSSCNTFNFTYIIYCRKCKSFYIGQSYRTVLIRLKEHLYKINNFVPFYLNCTTVSNHFNLKNHETSNFTFFIFNNNYKDDEARLHEEAKLIYLFRYVFHASIINNVFPSPYSKYKYNFSSIET